jgi:hypothetical protein
MRATRPNREWGYSTRRQCWATSAQRRCHPEEALYLRTFSDRFLIVNKPLSLSLSLSLSLNHVAGPILVRKLASKKRGTWQLAHCAGCRWFALGVRMPLKEVNGMSKGP